MNKAIVAIMAISFILLGALHTEAAEEELLIITIAGAISPGTAEFLIDGLERASASDAASVIIRLDTPGGLVESTRKIVQAIYACKVPVVVYVAPEGARAASAGVMITMAADIAAMAPSTNIGAAHPVGGDGKKIDDTMSEKVTNDIVAFAKGIAQRRGRNAVWAEKAVRESVSITATEAVKANVVDLVAIDMDDLIQKIHGRELPTKGKLAVENARRTVIKENLRTKILKIISDPNIAYILLMIGMAGLYFELSHPGTIFPGVVGGIALILAFFSLQTLPVNAAGILLIILAVIFFILELKVASYGMLSVAGIISLVLGSLMLFKGAGPQFQVAWQVLIPTTILISGFFVSLAYLVVQAHRYPTRTGSEGLVGMMGEVKDVVAEHGKVLVHAELWNAKFKTPVEVGDIVKIERVDDLVVTVSAMGQEEDEATP